MVQDSGAGTDYLGLIICGALFICGGIAGTVSAGFASVGDPGISGYLSAYLEFSGQDARPGFLPALFDACKYHLAVILFGFSIFGVFCVPALSAMRGFFLCFSISVIVRHFGGDGVLLALALSGVGAMLTVPCFFVLSASAFSSSLHVFKSVAAKGRGGTVSKPSGGGSFFRRACACAAVLACSALLDTLLMPELISIAARRIL